MGKVINDVSMSLDGFISGANVRPEAGLGDGDEQLHEWGFTSADPRNREIVESWAGTGAILVGRTPYDLSVPYWEADGPDIAKVFKSSEQVNKALRALISAMTEKK